MPTHAHLIELRAHQQGCTPAALRPLPLARATQVGHSRGLRAQREAALQLPAAATHQAQALRHAVRHRQLQQQIAATGR